MQSLNRAAMLAALAVLTVLPERSAGAEPAGDDRRDWSIYVADLFGDGGRDLGMRYRFGRHSAVNFSYLYERRGYDAYDDSKYQEFTVGYRQLLDEGRQRTFFGFEFAYAPGEDNGDEYRSKAYRAMLGLEYFLLPAFSLEGRAGLVYRRWDDADSSQSATTFPEVKLALNYHF